MKEDYLSIKDVAAVVNMNTLAQSMISKQNILKLIEKNLSKDKLVRMIVEEIHFNRNRWIKFDKFIPEE